MSERPIQVGDLVVKVRGCCGIYNGAIRTVQKIGRSMGVCKYCKSRVSGAKLYFVEDEMPSGGLVEWYMRIPPLSELETERTDEKLGVEA